MHHTVTFNGMSSRRWAKQTRWVVFTGWNGFPDASFYFCASFIKPFSVAQIIIFGLMLIFAIVGTIWSGSAPSTEERNDKP
ncbi:MAG: hypothetical protein BGO78_11015 [Chloroflexi bacterium 44-23]|nr:MAG: hypothetical protein BGO78_11015 [Chloroflexi bacterium 44-23]